MTIFHCGRELPYCKNVWNDIRKLIFILKVHYPFKSNSYWNLLQWKRKGLHITRCIWTVLDIFLESAWGACSHQWCFGHIQSPRWSHHDTLWAEVKLFWLQMVLCMTRLSKFFFFFFSWDTDYFLKGLWLYWDHVTIFDVLSHAGRGGDRIFDRHEWTRTSNYFVVIATLGQTTFSTNSTFPLFTLCVKIICH